MHARMSVTSIAFNYLSIYPIYKYQCAAHDMIRWIDYLDVLNSETDRYLEMRYRYQSTVNDNDYHCLLCLYC